MGNKKNYFELEELEQITRLLPIILEYEELLENNTIVVHMYFDSFSFLFECTKSNV